MGPHIRGRPHQTAINCRRKPEMELQADDMRQKFCTWHISLFHEMECKNCVAFPVFQRQLAASSRRDTAPDIDVVRFTRGSPNRFWLRQICLALLPHALHELGQSLILMFRGPLSAWSASIPVSVTGSLLSNGLSAICAPPSSQRRIHRYLERCRLPL